MHLCLKPLNYRNNCIFLRICALYAEQAKREKISCFTHSRYKASMKTIQGKILVNENDLNLDLSLLGGQSFRWKKILVEDKQNIWHGVACNVYWELKQTPKYLAFTAYTNGGQADLEFGETYYEQLLKQYLRLDFDLKKNIEVWRTSHQHFEELAPRMKAVRVLDQEPLENILSFICSQNNNIKRISTMIDWLCSKYGSKIGHFHSKDEYTFPTLNALAAAQNELEAVLRAAKFGYRAKFIAKSIARIDDFGGIPWFDKLRSLPYTEARNELVKLPGIGFKVADCICLMSLNHLESVPIDTHIFKIAQNVYMPNLRSVKAVTPKIYEDIADNFRKIYGPYAGWTQAVLFCSELQQFQTEDSAIKKPSSQKTKKQRCK